MYQGESLKDYYIFFDRDSYGYHHLLHEEKVIREYTRKELRLSPVFSLAKMKHDIEIKEEKLY